MQRAFGEALTLPFAFLDDGDYRLQTERYPEGLVADMVPCPSRNGAARLSTYNQQYWFRLLTIMQNELPLLEYLLGVSELNQLSMAFLSARPSTSPSLRDLTRGLEDFVGGENRWNQPLIRQAARLDRLYQESFDAARLPALDPARLPDPRVLLEEPLQLQPHWLLFAEDWQLVTLRCRVRQKKAEEGEQPIAGRGLWCIYRGPQGTRAHDLGPLQFQLLERLADGQPLGPACEALGASLDEAALAFLGRNIQSWFASWAALGWFCAGRC